MGKISNYTHTLMFVKQKTKESIHIKKYELFIYRITTIPNWTKLHKKIYRRIYAALWPLRVFEMISLR